MSARSLLLRVAQFAFVVAVFAYGGHAIATQWGELRGGADGADGAAGVLALRWLPLVAATALVFATYALLIQLWRILLIRWGAGLRFVDALRIWSISNLGRFVPGRVAQIAAMAVLARDRGVPAVTATGSAMLNTVINIAAGVLVALATGGHRLDRLGSGLSSVALLVVLAAGVGLVALPWLLPRAIALLARAFRRDVTVPALPASAVWLMASGHVVAWLLYGAAFQLFTAGTLGAAAGALPSYIAVYTGSYVAGYLVLFAPGGLGAREVVMVAALQAFGLATEPQAWLLAFASRLWLTLLEVLPGLLFLIHAALRRRPPISSGDAPA